MVIRNTGPGQTASGFSARSAESVHALEDLKDQAVEVRAKVVEAARERVRAAMQRQQARAADSLGNVATALQRAASQLGGDDTGASVAPYADAAADRVQRLANSLRHSDIDDIIAEVETYARRQPEVFLGGAFALGFLAARFVKSSGERRASRAQEDAESAEPPFDPAYTIFEDETPVTTATGEPMAATEEASPEEMAMDIPTAASAASTPGASHSGSPRGRGRSSAASATNTPSPAPFADTADAPKEGAS